MSDRRLVCVVDDDEAVRESLCVLLELFSFHVRAYDTADALLEDPRASDAACILTDVRMPGRSGIELLQELRRRGETMPVVVITGHGDIPMAVAAMRAGAEDFIEKPFEQSTVCAAITRAILDHSEAEGRSRPADPAAGVRERLKFLSERERQVLDGLVAGQANKVLALELGISPRTVEVHRAHVMSKMQASSLPELVRMVLLAELAQG